jgi:hypothetical protein
LSTAAVRELSKTTLLSQTINHNKYKAALIQELSQRKKNNKMTLQSNFFGITTTGKTIN